MRVLVVEDEPSLARDLGEGLGRAGFVVDHASDGETAWIKGDTETYDAVVLDLGLPVRDGLTVLKLWRSGGMQAPIIILSARGAWLERVEGIDAGADDYLPKPFEMAELVSRVRALTRRAAGTPAPVIAVGDLVLDTRRMSVILKGRTLELSPLEYRLLHFLALYPGRTCPATELADHLYGGEDARDPNAIEAVVARLRRKIGSERIETRRGFGYRLAEAAT